MYDIIVYVLSSVDEMKSVFVQAWPVHVRLLYYNERI